MEHIARTADPAGARQQQAFEGEAPGKALLQGRLLRRDGPPPVTPRVPTGTAAQHARCQHLLLFLLLAPLQFHHSSTAHAVMGLVQQLQEAPQLGYRY